MKVKGFGVAVAAFAAFTIGVAPALADVGDGQLGGPPATSGVDDDTLCPAGEAVTGVEGATRTIGGFIPIIAVATVQCSDGGVASTMGSGGGTPGSTSCPAGQVAVGIAGREGDFVDYLELRCQNADGTGPITNSSGFGGPFGTADGPYDCPAGTVLTGLRGQSIGGETIRYVEIVCETLVVDEDGDGIADTPPPADKDACMDGGWQSFNNPSFRNQGQCVSYVATRQ